MKTLFISLIGSLVAGVGAGAVAAPQTLREVSIALLEIDPKEVGSKARPERRRIIEAAMQLAVSDRAADLARSGLRLTIELNDIFQSHESASTAVKKTLSGKSLVAVGLPTSYYAEHGGLSLKGTELAVISPFATSSKLERHAPNLILLMPTNRYSATAFSSFVSSDIKPKNTVAIVPWDNAFSRDFYEEIPESMRASTKLIKILDDQQDLGTVTAQVDNLKPDVILLTSFPAFTGKIMRALHESGFRGTFVGPSSWGEGEGKPLHALTKDLPIRAFTVRETSEYFTTSEQTAFVGRFNQVTGMTFSSEAGLYYDGANLAIDRILEVGKGVDRTSLYKALVRKPVRCGIFTNVCPKGNKATSFYTFHVVSLEGGKFSPHKELHIERR